MELVTTGTTVINEILEKDVHNTNWTKQNVCLDEFVGEMTSETPDNDQSHQSVAEAEIEAEGNEESAKMFSANELVETSSR